jgi:hypothetical protein
LPFPNVAVIVTDPPGWTLAGETLAAWVYDPGGTTGVGVLPPGTGVSVGVGVAGEESPPGMLIGPVA